MIWATIAHIFSLPAESSRLKIHMAGANPSLNQSNYRIWQNIAKKKKTPGIQESLCLGV
jgi:hypothetical protein